MSTDLTNGEGSSRYDHMVTKLTELSTSQKSEGDDPSNSKTNTNTGIAVSSDDKSNESEKSASDSEDSDDEEDSSDDEPIHAPIELLSEFLQYVRTGHWEDAAKLCKMILIYEPDNQEALRFGPLIEEKMQIEKELAEEEESEESSEEETTDDSENEAPEEDEEVGESSSESEEERTEHLPNRLVFLHNQPIWKP